MASIVKRANGKFTVLVYWDKPYQTKISLSIKNRREAERTADYIQSLVDSHRNGTTNADVENWLARLRSADANLYGKLASLNLAEAVETPKTIKQLFELFLKKTNRKKSTDERYNQTSCILFTLLGENKPVDSITVEDAAQFVHALKTTPLNRRTKEPQIYATSHIARTLGRVKSIFIFAEQLGWIHKSPFRFVKTGSQVNQTKWFYVQKSDVLKILEHTDNPKWKAIIALGRFAGCRGASELFNLTWDRIDFENKTVTFHALKKEAFDDVDRTVPINDLLFQILSELKESQKENETPKLFSGMRYNDNTGTMTEKYIRWAGLEPWPEPWYNLRRSFCSDVMEAGVDPKVYEEVCGHSFETGMKHYQILHPDRKRRGIDRVREAMSKMV